jgi:ankyrin repeat protein
MRLGFIGLCPLSSGPSSRGITCSKLGSERERCCRRRWSAVMLIRRRWLSAYKEELKLAAQAAAANGHAEIVDLMLSVGADPNAVDSYWGSPLQAPAIGGRIVVRRLLESRADVNRRGENYETPLQAAVVGGYDEIVEMLVAYHADVNMEGGNYGTALLPPR